MKHERRMTGAFSVSAMDQVPVPEALLVSCLREWFSGPDGRSRVDRVLRLRLGERAADACLPALEDVFHIVASHGRRPLIRHEPGCPCVGVDEAVLAHFVMTAAIGEREDAMLIASLLVDARMLLALTEAARQAGLCLSRSLASRDMIPDPASKTRH